MVGLGGIWTEALDDVRLMPADTPHDGIIAELYQLKGARLLDGFRGSEPVNVRAIADAVMRVGALMRSRPEIAEIDINPLVAYRDRVLALDALIVAEPDAACQRRPILLDWPAFRDHDPCQNRLDFAGLA